MPTWDDALRLAAIISIALASLVIFTHTKNHHPEGGYYHRLQNRIKARCLPGIVLGIEGLTESGTYEVRCSDASIKNVVP